MSALRDSRNCQTLLADLEERVRVQMRPTLAVNWELILLYRNIGNEILAPLRETGRGGEAVERLAKDRRVS
jgi:hypothetical protein